MRDVAWGFFYGWVNFDNVLGTVNHYTTVDLIVGSYNATIKAAGVDILENFPSAQIGAAFAPMLDDWTHERLRCPGWPSTTRTSQPAATRPMAPGSAARCWAAWRWACTTSSATPWAAASIFRMPMCTASCCRHRRAGATIILALYADNLRRKRSSVQTPTAYAPING